MAAGNNLFLTIIYTSYLIIYASLKEIRLIVQEELMPQDLGDLRTYVRTYGRVHLYMPPTLWGIKIRCILYQNPSLFNGIVCIPFCCSSNTVARTFAVATLKLHRLPLCYDSFPFNREPSVYKKLLLFPLHILFYTLCF